MNVFEEPFLCSMADLTAKVSNLSKQMKVIQHLSEHMDAHSSTIALVQEEVEALKKLALDSTPIPKWGEVQCTLRMLG